MSAADTAWFRMDRPDNLMIITAVLWFDTPLPHEVIRDLIDRRIVQRFPRFRQRVVAGGPLRRGSWWEDDPAFSLDRHLHHVALERPGDRSALQRLVSEVMTEDLPRDRPLWQLWVVDGYGRGGAIIARIHHCLADGISLARVLLSITDDTVGAAGDDLIEGGSRGRSGLSRLGHLLGSGLATVTRPSRLVGGLAETARDAVSLARLVAMPPDRRTALRGHLSGTKHAVWSEPIPLDEVKTIGRAAGATVNDVLLCAMGGAVGQHLAAHGTPTRDIRAFVPYNLRPLSEPVPAELGNEFGLVLLSLPVGVDDPAQRLAEVHRRMETVKSSPDGLVSYGILSAMGHSPSAVERVLVGAFGLKASAVMTNVPGPRHRLMIGGQPVTGIIAWVPTSAQIGLGVSIFSYAGDVVVGVAADRAVLPHPGEIVESFEDELARLAQSVTSRVGGAADRSSAMPSAMPPVSTSRSGTVS
jgi:diacylglycerol O-acyltransferase / wax synthase